MKKIIIFSDDEIHDLASGKIVEMRDGDGTSFLFMNKNRYAVSCTDLDDYNPGTRMKTEITYEDIYDDWRRNYPKLASLVEDYRPAGGEYMSIIVWTEQGKYLYNYITKELRAISR